VRNGLRGRGTQIVREVRSRLKKGGRGYMRELEGEVGREEAKGMESVEGDRGGRGCMVERSERLHDRGRTKRLQ